MRLVIEGDHASWVRPTRQWTGVGNGFIFTVNSGIAAKIQDVTIRNGSAASGGIYNAGTVTSSKNTFSGNSGAYGGSLANFSETTVKNSMFANRVSGNDCHKTLRLDFTVHIVDLSAIV